MDDVEERIEGEVVNAVVHEMLDTVSNCVAAAIPRVISFFESAQDFELDTSTYPHALIIKPCRCDCGRLNVRLVTVMTYNHVIHLR